MAPRKKAEWQKEKRIWKDVSPQELKWEQVRHSSQSVSAFCRGRSAKNATPDPAHAQRHLPRSLRRCMFWGFGGFALRPSASTKDARTVAELATKLIGVGCADFGS